MKDILKTIEEIEARISNKPTHYTSMRNEDYYECSAGYNDYMSHAMASDMSCFQLMLNAKYPELSDMLDRWMLKMSTLNYNLLRMIDDDAEDRPMKPWKFKKTIRFAAKIQDVMKEAIELNTKEPDNLLTDFISHCKVWTIRVLYMNTWAYCLENMENIEQMRTGNKISGLDKDKQKLITNICSIREKLINLIIEIPPTTNDYKYIMDKIDLFNRMCQKITKGKE